MNRDLRIMDLEDALRQAVWTIEFLHGCLTDEKYSYEYPEQTVDRLKDFRELLPDMPRGCFHSYHSPSCEDCIAISDRHQKRRDLQEAGANDS